MTTDEVISKAEYFAMGFIAKLTDPKEQPERKQVFFMDNQDDLKKYMGALQKIVNSFSEDDVVAADDQLLIDRAGDVIKKLKGAIGTFQSELTVNPNLTEEDATATLTEETISKAMKDNKTTQEITANMNAIAEQQKATQLGYNYALVCDGQINMIGANSKEELNNAINSLANQGSYKNIQLFKMQFTPVPLKQQTILTV